MSSFSVSVYHRKRAGQIEWVTLGLGPHDVRHAGANETKLHRKIAEKLRTIVRELSPLDQARFELVRGRRLVRVRLDLAFGTGKKTRLAGLFPLVLEPRARTAEESVTLAYHPLRQGDWFVVADDAPLEDQARRFFNHVFGETEPGDPSELLTDGKDRLRIVSFTERGRPLNDQLPDSDEDAFADLEREAKGSKKKKRRRTRAILSAVGVNVTAQVPDRLVRIGRPREPWRSQLAELGSGPRKTPVVLVGPPGVGKSTLLMRWVADLLDADDFATHRNLDRVHEVWQIGAKRILAGMSHVGEWEERCLALLREASDRRVILWVEDLHTFGRAGRSQDSDRTLADLFRGPLARGELRIVAECTEPQWRRLEEDASSFADLFTVLRVEPPTTAETISLMLHETRALEESNRALTFTHDAYRAILGMGSALYPGAAQPGVSIDLLQRLAAEVAFAASESEDAARIDGDAVVRFFSRRTGLPEALLRVDRVLNPLELEARFESHVMGQPEAVQAAVDLVARIRAGLTDRDRPYATYLFTGPTGTGKTQMAKAIAGFLYGSEARLVRIDMGELSGPDAVPRLIGDRFDPRGLLTDAVREQPFCVVLLDEIEKAHPAVLQLLLQMLDEGRLTDAAGDLADFRRAVIVLTSNLGGQARPSLGFDPQMAASAGVVREAKDGLEFFPPELFNRIDRVVRFRPLTTELAERVAEKELAQLLARRGLTDRRVFVFADRDAISEMAKDAFDVRGGARSVKRWLESVIGTLLADELAKGSRAELRILRIYREAGAYRLHVDDLVEAEVQPGHCELSDLLDATARVLSSRFGGLALRVRALDELERPSASADALYYVEEFRAQVAKLREDVEMRASREPDAEDVVDARRPGPGTYPGVPRANLRVLDRRAAARRTTMDRELLIRSIADVARFERAVDRLTDPHEHRVFVELLRIGQGRRPARYDRARDGLFEWLARAYAGLGFELGTTAGRDEEGVVEESTVLEEILEKQPVHLMFELAGVAVRTTLEAERGCHAWSSLLHGSEIVRVRILDADSTPRASLTAHRSRATEFARALSRGDRSVTDPAALLPVVRRLRFDPPDRPGETAPLEIEDYATGSVRAAQVADPSSAIGAMVWLGASRRPSDE